MHDAARVTQLASSQANDGDLELASTRLREAEKSLRDNAGRTKDVAQKKKLEKQAERLGRVEQEMRRATKASPSKRKESSRKAALELNDAAMDSQGY